ncbi:MAG: HNH endonuclease [Streptosporangiaceae bacterium]
MSGSWTAPPGWYSLRKTVFATKGRLCWYCSRPATTVDHVRPLCLGGTNDLTNLVPACRRCNFSRGARVGNRLIGLQRHQQHTPITTYQDWPRSRRWLPRRRQHRAGLDAA